MMKTEVNMDEGWRLKDEAPSTFHPVRAASLGPPGRDGLPPSSFAVLRRATIALADTDSPRLTAEALLAHVLGVTRTQLLSRPERIVLPHALAKYEQLIARAAVGEPLAYLTGRREFCGLDFLVDARVLVPRPETELLVELALKFTAEFAENAESLTSPSNSAHSALSAVSSPLHILDMGTGSGCLAVTLAARLPSAHITALDISADALALARLNAERHHAVERITFVQSDLLSALQPPTSNLQSPISTFHLLVANLPYISSDELRRLPVSKHEPVLALDGGPDGLALIRRLLAAAPRVMALHGRLLLEINDEKSIEALDLARAVFPNARVEIHQDLAGLDRVLAIAL